MDIAARMGGLHFSVGKDGLRVSLVAAGDLEMELPPDFDAQIRNRVDELLAESRAASIYVDMEQLPAISSRQLGSLLALQKAVRERLPRLPLRNVSRGVRRLFETTRTAPFFESGE